MLLLEIFSGTGSVGRVAKSLGFEVISLDLAGADINTDILEWDYKGVDWVPSFICCSPPCCTYSSLNNLSKLRRNDRDWKTALPLTPRAQLGTDLLYRTLDIIDYFLSKNKDLKWVIENPAMGCMNNDQRMKSLYSEVTSYNQFGDTRYKPTRIWSNFVLGLPRPKRPKKGTTTTIRYAPRHVSYPIPADLVKHILSL